MFEHFLTAQAPVYDDVTAELAAGRKRTHWMWFIFPHLAGLGRSAMAQRFALAGLDEAGAYLAHPILGARLRECAGLALGQSGRGAHAIFGSPDDMKFRSSMTLFALASEREAAPETDQGGAVFRAALEAFFDGREDEASLRLLGLG